MTYVPPAKRPRETSTFDRRLTIALIDEASQAFGVRSHIIRWGGRSHNILRPRWAVMYALRSLGWSYPRIGHLFDMDHSTVMNAMAGCEKVMASNKPYRDLVFALSATAAIRRKANG